MTTPPAAKSAAPKKVAPKKAATPRKTTARAKASDGSLVVKFRAMTLVIPQETRQSMRMMFAIAAHNDAQALYEMVGEEHSVEFLSQIRPGESAQSVMSEFFGAVNTAVEAEQKAAATSVAAAKRN